MGIIDTTKNIMKSIAGVYETISGQGMPNSVNNHEKNERGMQVYTMSQLVGVSGRSQDGQLVTGTVEQPIFYLNLEEREGIYRLCAPVNAVVTGRMNRIAGLDWTITMDRSEEDRIAGEMKSLKQIFDEYANSIEIPRQVVRGQIVNTIKQTLPDVLPDLSNFNAALLRWKHRIDKMKTASSDEVSEWLREPNINDKWEDFVKKYVYDLLIHGSSAIYKEVLNGKIENFYLLAGGTVLPLKDAYVGGLGAFVQVTQGYEPQIYYGDEISYSQYSPSTARANGYVPLEALMNKLSETMLFDKLMAEQADGTKLPEKMVLVTEAAPFGGLDKEFSVAMDPDKQKRIETKLNQPKKGSIITFSGNSATVIDLSKENTMQIQMQRQKDIREEVGLVFQASNMEMNLSDSDGTSGRSTAQAQADIMMAKGINPIIRQLETKINRDILPYRYGWDYKFAFDSGESETDKIALLQQKMATGLFSVNELRSDDLNLEMFPGDEFNKPAAAQPAAQGASEQNPLFTKAL